MTFDLLSSLMLAYLSLSFFPSSGVRPQDTGRSVQEGRYPGIANCYDCCMGQGQGLSCLEMVGAHFYITGGPRP